MDTGYYWELYNREIMQIIGRTIKQQKIKSEDMISDAYFWLNAANIKYNETYGIPHKNYCLNYLYQYFRQYYRYYNRRQITYGSDSVPKNTRVDSLQAHTNEYDEYEFLTYDDEAFNNGELMDIINTFPPKYQKLLILTAQGYKQREIADILGIKQPAVVQMYRTLTKPYCKHKDKVKKLYEYLKS